MSSLIEGAKCGDISAVEELIPLSTRKSLSKAFHWSVKNGHNNVAKLLLSHNCPIKDKTFREAVDSSNVEIVSEILKRKTNFNLDFSDALIQLIVMDELEILELLVEHRVNINLDAAVITAKRVNNIKALELLK